MSSLDSPKFGDVWRDPSDGETVMLVNESNVEGTGHLDWAVIQLIGINGHLVVTDYILHRVINDRWEKVE